MNIEVSPPDDFSDQSKNEKIVPPERTIPQKMA